MKETWRDVMNDAIRERLMETHKSEFDVANEESRDLCDAIFDALEIEPEVQDTSWDAIADIVESIKEMGAKGPIIRFEYATGIEVRTRFGVCGYITMLGYTEDGRSTYLVETAGHSDWMMPIEFTIIPPYGMK